MSRTQRILLLFTISILIITISIVGFTYAFFVTKAKGNGIKNDVTVGKLGLKYDDSSSAINASNISPGWSSSKTLKVTNTGNVEQAFDLVFLSLTNTFQKSEFVYSITCSSSSGTCGTKTETAVPATGTNQIMLDNVSIAANVTYTYTVTFKFLSKDEPQNYNNNATFNATIGIKS